MGESREGVKRPRSQQAMIEVIPNVSEGRRGDVVEEIVEAIGAVTGAHLLDWSSDPSHNRAVFTLVGEASPVQQALLRLFEIAVARIDMRTHRGEHPRIGAVDVVPFVPLGATPTSACVDLARTVGAQVADRFDLPIFLYEQAATAEPRRRLEAVRRGQFEGLAEKLVDPGWRPDYGPRHPHPTAGATAVGARGPLIAFNVNLDTDNLAVARQIARRVRASDGGLPSVKALGVRLADRSLVQVSMNLTDYRRTSLSEAVARVTREAERLGVTVAETEVIGLVPQAALDRRMPTLDGRVLVRPDQTLEARLARARRSPRHRRSAGR